MIPKKLTIKGLYSYSEEATINFERLSQAHIFGIFGNVGSGKSTILEAMMLALYGEVPRLGHGKGDNRNFNMMNLKSNELCVDFEFEAGGKKYKSIVEAKRNAKKFEEVASPRFRRYVWDESGQAWTPLNFEPAEVIGLKLEHFTKTIIVPQNQFQEFLQLKDTERSKMMSDLFNLERFDLAKKATAIENRNKVKVAENEFQLGQLGDVTKEKIDEIKTQLADLERLTADDTSQLKEKQQSENALTQLKKQFDTLNILKNRLGEFENRTPQYNALEKQLLDFEYCQLHFQHLIEQSESAAKSVAENTALLQQNLKEFADNERVLTETKTLHKSLQPQFDNRHNRLREAEELSHILTIQKAEKAIFASSQRVEKGNLAVQKQRSIIEELRTQRNALEAERAGLKSPNFIELGNIKNWFSKFNALKKESETIEKGTAQFTESLAAIEVNRRKLVVDDLPFFGEKYPPSTTLSEAILMLKKGIESKEAAISASNKKMQHELAVLELENLATSLEDGKPCPLCGSVHHPELMNTTNVQRLVADIEKEISVLNSSIKSLQNIGNQLETLQTTFIKVTQDRKISTQQQADKQAEIGAHERLFEWKHFSKNDEEAVNIAFVNADLMVKRIEELNKNVQEKTKNIEHEKSKLDQYEVVINGLNSEIAVNNAQKQTLMQQLQTLKLSDFVEATEDILLKKQTDIREAVKLLELQFVEVEKQLEKRAEKAAILRGGISELERNKAKLDAQLTSASGALNARLTASVFTNLDAVRTILTAKINVEFEKKRLTDFRSESNAAKKAHDELALELTDKNYSVENHQSLITDIQELDEKIENQNQRIGGLKTTLSDAKNKLTQRLALEKERSALDLRAKNINELKRLFYASGFVSYASTIYLKSLIQNANERFERLTNYRLRLEVTADNTFLVSDILNDGKTRNVKTLSGGQTFQAALSLALALADNIQSLTKSPQNFFFLDEGFGSLDKDSLHVVFETLKSLRRENRIVGVISHVEEMQQEIEHHVRVVLDEEKGSQLSYH
jgi:DNA repair protein SbcC/Rad50